MQRGEVVNPIMVLLLPMVTCGVYGIYWLYKTMNEINAGLGREEFNVTPDLILTFVTCGIYGLYLYWKMANAVVELQQAWGVQPEMDATILFVLCFVMGLGPFFMQQGLNNAWETGTPGGAGGGGMNMGGGF